LFQTIKGLSLVTSINQKPFLFKIILGVIVGCVLVILILNFAVKFVFETISPVVFPDSVYAIKKTSDQFVTALKAGDKEEVYRLLDDTAEGSQAMHDMEVLVNEEAIINYEGLDICDRRNKGEVLDNFGLIHFKDTSVWFNIQLIKDANKSLKVHRFILLPELKPGPFEDCQ
jgi:hypothetical protein